MKSKFFAITIWVLCFATSVWAVDRWLNARDIVNVSGAGALATSGEDIIFGDGPNQYNFPSTAVAPYAITATALGTVYIECLNQGWVAAVDSIALPASAGKYFTGGCVSALRINKAEYHYTSLPTADITIGYAGADTSRQLAIIRAGQHESRAAIYSVGNGQAREVGDIEITWSKPGTAVANSRDTGVIALLTRQNGQNWRTLSEKTFKLDGQPIILKGPHLLGSRTDMRVSVGLTPAETGIEISAPIPISKL